MQLFHIPGYLSYFRSGKCLAECRHRPPAVRDHLHDSYAVSYSGLQICCASYASGTIATVTARAPLLKEVMAGICRYGGMGLLTRWAFLFAMRIAAT